MILPSCMTITGTRTSDHHVIDGVVILFSDINCINILQFLISKSVKFCKSNPEVGSLEKILDLLAVGIKTRWIKFDVGWKNSEKIQLLIFPRYLKRMEFRFEFCYYCSRCACISPTRWGTQTAPQRFPNFPSSQKSLSNYSWQQTFWIAKNF